MIDTVLQLSLPQIMLIIFSPIVVWGGFVLVYYLKTKEVKIFRYEFTVFRYCIFMTAIATPFIFFIIFTGNYDLLLFFVLAGFGGVLGEYLFSLWWRKFFWKGFWDYKHAAILRGDTSLLNFPAWGVGGVLVIFIFYIFNRYGNLNLIDLKDGPQIIEFLFNSFVYILGGIVASVIMGRIVLKKNFRGKLFLRYSLFSLGIVIFITLIVCRNGFSWLYLFIIWGLICFIAEYMFGKGSTKFLSKKLWLYNYLTIDNNHTSILNILPFALGGFYFFCIYLLTQLIMLYI